MIRRFNPIRRDERGAAAMEFGLVAPLMCTIMIAVLDIGHSNYVASQAQGVIHHAARLATIGDKTGPQIDTYVTEHLRPLAQNANIVIEKKNYSDYTGVKKAEKIITDTAPFGVYNAKTATTPGDCHEDANPNGVWDRDRGRTGLGGADDVVRYEVTATYDRLTPMAGLLGWSTRQEIKVNTLLKNQPFAAQIKTAPVICA